MIPRAGVIPGDADHPGERLQQVAARTDAVLDRFWPLLLDGNVAVVAHGHLQRVLTARWLDLDPSAGRLFPHPHPGTLSVLRTEQQQRVVGAWNSRSGRGTRRTAVRSPRLIATFGVTTAHLASPACPALLWTIPR